MRKDLMINKRNTEKNQECKFVTRIYHKSIAKLNHNMAFNVHIQIEEGKTTDNLNIEWQS